MRSKSILILIELMIMLLVFSVAAIFCVKAFALSNKVSKDINIRAAAVSEVESAAEILKAYKGDGKKASAYRGGTWDGKTWRIESDGIIITAKLIDDDNINLGIADVLAIKADGTIVYAVQVAWQEAARDEQT